MGIDLENAEPAIVDQLSEGFLAGNDAVHRLPWGFDEGRQACLFSVQK